MLGIVCRPKDVTDSKIIIKLVHNAKREKGYREVRTVESGMKDEWVDVANDILMVTKATAL